MKVGYPVVDLFAGPGGLGEGFASLLEPGGQGRFQNILSVERDIFSHQTLTLRHFFRHFTEDEVPDDYYDFTAGRISLDELFARHPVAHAAANKSALRLSLGEKTHAHVRQNIRDRIGQTNRWALVGGPPCQAYSLVGRSRMMGQPDFDRDERHTLYLEYLRILADHQPPVFVMENVKGLLSATIEGKSAITRIVSDLSRPATAIHDAPPDLTYKLYSLTEEEQPGGEIDPRLFVVRAENYGIPQARHRMFILGIRGDLDARPGILKTLIAPSVRETIGALPKIRSALSRTKDNREAWLREYGCFQRSISGNNLTARVTQRRSHVRSMPMNLLMWTIRDPHMRAPILKTVQTMKS